MSSLNAFTCVGYEINQSMGEEGMKNAFLVFVLGLLFCVFPAAAFAQDDLQGDVFLSFGSEPVRDFGSTAGFGVGLSVPFSRFGEIDLGGHEKSMMLRTDITYYRWSERFSAGGTRSRVSLRKVPLYLAARYSHAFNEQLSAFGEAGLELSFDDTKVSWNQGTSSDSEINAGIALGAGLEYSWPGHFFAGGNLRFHAITDGFVSLAAFFGRRF
jgi:opacity protein-like surface antigen